MGDNFSITNNKKAILQAIQTKGVAAMEACGLKAEAFAVKACPVDTGVLKNSITHEVVNDADGGIEMILGTAVEYAPYVEMGTGVYVSGGRRTPWAYQDSKGNYHITKGQRPQPFIKPAINDHRDLYKKIIENELKK